MTHTSQIFSLIFATVLALFSMSSYAGKPQPLETQTLFGGPFFVGSTTPYNWLECSIVATVSVIQVKIEICYTDETVSSVHPVCQLMDESVLQAIGDIQSVAKSIEDIPYNSDGYFQQPTMYCKVTFDGLNSSAIRGTACLTEGGSGPGVCVTLQ